MANNLVKIVCLLSILAPLGCGGDDDNGPSSSKQLNTLNQQEIDSLCKNNVDRIMALYDDPGYRQAYTNITCTQIGLVRASTKEQCETARDQCITTLQRMADAGVFDIDLNTSTCPTASTLNACDVTVGELNRCTAAALGYYQDEANAFIRTASAITCDLAGQPFDAGTTGVITDSDAVTADIPECADLYEKCPATRGIYSSLLGASLAPSR